MHLPTLRWYSLVFDQKLHDPRDAHVPPLLMYPIFPRGIFFLFPWMKKVLKGEHFADVEEVKQKTAEALKDIKIDEFKTVLSSGKNISIGVLHQMGSIFEVTEV